MDHRTTVGVVAGLLLAVGIDGVPASGGSMDGPGAVVVNGVVYVLGRAAAY